MERAKKVRVGQAKLVLWDDIKDNPPPQLKILPIAAIPHKSKAFRSILDLSFSLHLKNGGILESVNDSTIKMAPRGALDQLGQALSRIIHAFAKADEDAKIFMAKWDINDGFWHMDCEIGEEYNFAYVLPQEEGTQLTLVVPPSLQMGWVESPPYFCAVTETARDITARVQTGYYGNGKQVKNCTVSSAITAVGQTIALACDSNPTKVVGSKCLLPHLQIMLDGYWKVNQATRKKLPSNPTSLNSLSKRRTNKGQLNASEQPRI
jgi:hypothetical protein